MNLSTFVKFFLAFSLSYSGLTAAYKVTATGRILCHGAPLKYSRISLMDNDPFIDDFMGSSTTDGNGYFRVEGSGKDIAIKKKKRRPDVYIRLDYRHSSSRARFEVDRPLIRGGKEESHTKKNRKGNVDFGTLHFNTEMCRIYQRFYEATHDFHRRVGYRVPFKLNIKAQAIIHGGAPFALYNKIRIPKGKKVSLQTAQHELAHTVRHKYDGNLAHFLKDVIKYKYMRNHHCMQSTNHGFAFNEGWAEYWSNDICGTASGSMKVEGNVAAALRDLQRRCRTTDRNMWEVLRRNRGRIHSYKQFASKHKSLFGCN